MEEKSESTQIQDICQYANLAISEEDDTTAYQQYVHAFEALLRSHIARIDDKKSAAMKEIISHIFIVYEDMLDAPDQAPIQSDKLAKYIETLITHIKEDATYLQRWKLLSCIDALSDAKSVPVTPFSTSGEDLEAFVENSLDELNALLEVEQQKIDMRHENDLINDDDDDQLSKELEAILQLSAEDIYADLPHTLQKYQEHQPAAVPPLKIDDLDQSDHNSTLGEDKELRHFTPIKKRASSPNPSNSETDSQTTHEDSISTDSDSRSSSAVEFEHSTPTPHKTPKMSHDPLLLPFTEQLHNVIGQFHNGSLAKNMKLPDHSAFEFTTDQIVRTLLDAYKHCFQTGLNTDNVSDFDKVIQSITSHWSYWAEEDLSKASTALMAQAVSKLHANLLDLTNDMRKNAPDEAQRSALKNR